jgi:hypothetical protein
MATTKAKYVVDFFTARMAIDWDESMATGVFTMHAVNTKDKYARVGAYTVRTANILGEPMTMGVFTIRAVNTKDKYVKMGVSTTRMATTEALLAVADLPVNKPWHRLYPPISCSGG